MINSFSINQLNELPQVLIFFTIAQIVMNTLAYIAIGAYWTEVMVLASNRVESENLKIKSLLLEREALISGLLKVNKTVATGALSASIAHELNQPLGASYLNIQFLQKKLAEGSLTAEQNQEVLSALLSDNQRAANIIRSLRSIFSDGKIGAEQVDLDELIEAVLKITKPEIQSKNIQVVLSLSSNTLVNINRTEIQQVVLNLINNAIQALAESRSNAKTLKIESHDVADGVEILITDNGPGIPMEAQSHLFELLADSNKKTGMGLGLWLCRHIITRHGGNIEYQDAKGGGAQFGIFLPSSPN
jgi:signal transduction histidine kinase